MMWFCFSPMDTLFFKGAEPMVMGENHIATAVFPPPAHTISGALRTTVLRQQGIPFDAYGEDGFDDRNIINAIGRAGEEAPFDVVGPLFQLYDTVLVPAPYSWMTDRGVVVKNGDNPEPVEVPVYPLKPVESDFICLPGTETLAWARGNSGALETLGGCWVALNQLNSVSSKVVIYSSSALFSFENRVGIALDRNRTVREGHIYTFAHVRLFPHVKLVFGCTRRLPLQNHGVLKLGGEQRYGGYKRTDIELPDLQTPSRFYMALSHVPGTDAANAAVWATGQIKYFGGWDLHKGFHKDMRGFFPPGSVFTKQFNDNLIAI